MNTGTTGGTDTLVPEIGGKKGDGGTYLIQNNADEVGLYLLYFFKFFPIVSISI